MGAMRDYLLFMAFRTLIGVIVLITQLMIAISPSCAGYDAYSNIGLHAHPTGAASDLADIVTTASQQVRTMAAPLAVRRGLDDLALALAIIEELFPATIASTLYGAPSYASAADQPEREIYLRHSVLRI